MANNTLGIYIVRQRKNLNMSQRELAKQTLLSNSNNSARIHATLVV